MSFLDLYKKIAQLDEGLSECGMEGCDMGPSESPKQQDTVSMNVSMNGSGKNGIKDLLDVLRNIEQSGSDDELFGEPGKLSHNEPVMGDSFENSVDGASDTTTLDISAVTPTGDDLLSKGKEAPKQAGGGNPWNVSESAIAAKLLRHYEEVKSRNTVTEGYWGWDPPDEDEGPEYWYGHGKREIEEIQLSAPYDLPNIGVKAGDPIDASVVADCNGEDFSVVQVSYYDEAEDDMIPLDLKLAGQQWVSNVEAECSDSLQTEYTGRDDDYDDYDYDDGGKGWQDAQNAWERGRDSRVREARETDFDINNPRAAGKMQGAMDREFKDFKRQEHEAEWRREQEIRQAEREAKQNAEDGPWYINSGGKILRTGGQPKVFDSLRGAKGYVKAIRKSRPNYSAILTRNPEDTDPLDFMKRSLRLNYNFTSEPGATASGYQPGRYNHYRGAEGDKTLQKAYEYFVALSKDPNTDPEIQQKSAADAEAMAKELEYRKQQGTIG